MLSAISLEWVSAISGMRKPGTTWEYSLSTDVLGRIVEVVSGQSLDRFVAERITGPLKMRDTGYSAPMSNAARGARPHAEGPKGAGRNDT